MVLLYASVGLVIGGVLNALADGLPSRARLRSPHCKECETARGPASWLATTGYLVARGRCARCDARFPLRDMLVELATAVFFGFLYSCYGLTGHMLLLSVYVAILILITVIDLEHRLVLNRVIAPAILLALLAGPFTPGLNWAQMLVGGLVGFGLFYLAAILYPGGMGAGDVKLAAFIGLITGFPSVFVALLVTVFAGGLISLLLIVTRILSRHDYIPYGPFLVIGGLFALFWGQPIMDNYLDRDENAQVLETVVTQANPFEDRWVAVASDGQESVSLVHPNLDPHPDPVRRPRSELNSTRAIHRELPRPLGRSPNRGRE